MRWVSSWADDKYRFRGILLWKDIEHFRQKEKNLSTVFQESDLTGDDTHDFRFPAAPDLP